jgi:hypothetical protein
MTILLKNYNKLIISNWYRYFLLIENINNIRNSIDSVVKLYFHVVYDEISKVQHIQQN